MGNIKLVSATNIVFEYDKPVDGFKLAEDALAKDSKSPDAKKALAIKINGTIQDMSCKIRENGNFEFVTFDSKDGKNIFRHSASHIMAKALKRVVPDAKLAIGPAVEDGFYYDFDSEKTITPEDLKIIEEEMRKIVKDGIVFERFDLSLEDGIKKVRELKEPYKEELINDLGDDVTVVSFYQNKEFTDLCRGPHVPTTKYVQAFKLTKLAGAYWRGDAKNKQLQRIYGVAFPTKDELKEYLHLLEEAEKRDHRKLGKKLKLFSFHDEGPGFPFWHPKGLFIFNKLIEFWREEHKKNGYVEVKTPILLSRKLWETSGHWMNYRQNMYLTKIDEDDFAIKPMNCPGGFLMYTEDIHSYRELPLRVGEIGLVHRHELSGVLSGLFRVRQFHQDDAHIFMTTEQIKDEILGVIKLADRFYSLFGLTYHMELSTRPEKGTVGTDEQWEAATKGLKSALDEAGKTYKINPGDGAFYGPKIDFHIKDALGRTWQCGTIQLDMSLPEKFDLTYEGKDGKKHRPVMIHRVIYGSLERFIGILIEHYAGKFPLWLSPVQVRILSISETFNKYAEKIKAQYDKEGIRVELDSRGESISKKIREAQLDKINYIIVIGEKEETNNTVNIRTRDNTIHGEKGADEFLKQLQEEISENN